MNYISEELKKENLSKLHLPEFLLKKYYKNITLISNSGYSVNINIIAAFKYIKAIKDIIIENEDNEKIIISFKYNENISFDIIKEYVEYYYKQDEKRVIFDTKLKNELDKFLKFNFKKIKNIKHIKDIKHYYYDFIKTNKIICNYINGNVKNDIDKKIYKLLKSNILKTQNDIGDMKLYNLYDNIQKFKDVSYVDIDNKLYNNIEKFVSLYISIYKIKPDIFVRLITEYNPYNKILFNIKKINYLYNILKKSYIQTHNIYEKTSKKINKLISNINNIDIPFYHEYVDSEYKEKNINNWDIVFINKHINNIDTTYINIKSIDKYNINIIKSLIINTEYLYIKCLNHLLCVVYANNINNPNNMLKDMGYDIIYSDDVKKKILYSYELQKKINSLIDTYDSTEKLPYQLIKIDKYIKYDNIVNTFVNTFLEFKNIVKLKKSNNKKRINIIKDISNIISKEFGINKNTKLNEYKKYIHSIYFDNLYNISVNNNFYLNSETNKSKKNYEEVYLPIRIYMNNIFPYLKYEPNNKFGLFWYNKNYSENDYFALFSCVDYSKIKFIPHKNIHYLYNVCDNKLENIRHLKHIKYHYVIADDKYLNVNINIFSLLSKLKTLNINSSQSLNDNLLKKLLSLKYLTIYACENITNIGFSYIQGLKYLNMSYCNQITISDKAFSYLYGLEALNMSYCDQISITYIGFSYLTKLKKLNMNRCIQISDKGFFYLSNLKNLKMNNCHQISDKGLFHLSNLNNLNMYNCNQSTITNIGFSYLYRLKRLSMPLCNKSTISDIGFSYLINLEYLNIVNCNKNNITNEAFKNLKKLKHLIMVNCNQKSIDHNAFINLIYLQSLNISNCIQLTNKIFKNLKKLKKLTINYCVNITDDAFKTIKNLEFLSMEFCNKITDMAFIKLFRLKELNIQNCRYITNEGLMINELKGLKNLNIFKCYQLNPNIIKKYLTTTNIFDPN